MLLVIRIAKEWLEKARKSAKLVPEQRTIHRGTSTYQAVVWVDPTAPTAPAQHGFDFGERDTEADAKNRVTNYIRQGKYKEGADAMGEVNRPKVAGLDAKKQSRNREAPKPKGEEKDDVGPTWSKDDPEAEARRRWAQGEAREADSPKVRKYYVTMAREGRKDHAWLAGPYDTHEEALSRVDEAREHAHRVDPRSVFDAFGTASYEAGEGKHIQGKLNDLMKKKAEGKEVGPSAALYLRVEGSKNLAPVASFKEASEKFAKVRDEAERQGGGGASKTPRVEVVDANNKVVGVVSYNGRVWAPKDYGKTDAGIKPIYDNRKPKMAIKVR